MQTNFSVPQLRDPATARSNEILRTCVHCGFCTATCPTYQVLGDELDSPRGRIYLIKEMLETGRTPDAKTVKHIDRCLSCLSCMTTCPSGVHYMHLVDHARAYVEEKYRRPWDERALRWLLAKVLPYPGRFRLALYAARLARPFRRALPDPRLRAMLEMAPGRIAAAAPSDRPQVLPAEGLRRRRVALMTGCAQKALDPAINEATLRLLRRHGCEVVIAKGAGCCGALTHHMGREAESHAAAKANIRAFMREIDGDGLDAIVINTSGCGTTVKDYGHMLRGDPLAADAARVAALARDVSEVMAELGLRDPRHAAPLRVAYHAACSLQHGQKIRTHPKDLLRAAGFTVVEPREGHLCCGSAGTYNLLQPEISAKLKARKVANIAATEPEVIAAGNIGCMMQIGSAMETPIVHTVELLDWATGGPKPAKLAAAARRMTVAILVSDVDRTLLTHDHVLPEAVCAAVRLARARGLRVMLASARSPVGIAPIARRLGTEALAICFNGAWIGSLETGATLDARPLGHGDAVAALAAARAAGLPAIAYGAAAAYATAADAAATAPELAITGEPLVEIAAPGALDAPVFKVMAVAHGPEAEARFVALRAGLPAGLAAARSAGHLLEIVAPGVSKGAAAALAAASLGLDGAAAAAAGDAENDLSLLAWAGIRLTVANAAPAVKALADHVGPSCDEGGIAEAIAWLLEHAGGAG